jgi:hypothetical protein
MSGVHQEIGAAALQSDVRDNYARAVKCVLAMYPGLRTRALAVGVRGDNWQALNSPIRELRSLTLLIGQGPDADAPGGEQPPILTVYVAFSDDHCIDRITADGPLTGAKKREAIEKLIADTPGITKSRLESVLQAAGARFGPARDSEVQTSVQDTFKRLSPLIDTPTILQLYWSQDNMPVWNAVIAGTCGGRKTTYNALFEPFEGYLIGLGKGP